MKHFYPDSFVSRVGRLLPLQCARALVESLHVLWRTRQSFENFDSLNPDYVTAACLLSSM